MTFQDCSELIFIFRLEQRIDGPSGKLCERFVRRGEYREGATALQSFDEPCRLDSGDKRCVIFRIDGIVHDVLVGEHRRAANHGIIRERNGGQKAKTGCCSKRDKSIFHWELPELSRCPAVELYGNSNYGRPTERVSKLNLKYPPQSGVKSLSPVCFGSTATRWPCVAPGLLPVGGQFPGPAAQLALRPRKAGISRTFSSIVLRTGDERPYGSRRCGAACRAYSAVGVAGRPSEWRAIGRSGGLSKGGGGAPRSIRLAMRRLSLRSRPASSVSEPSTGCVWRTAPRLSMPVATTETRTIPSRLASKVAPTMMLASGSASSRIRVAASSTSNSVRSLPPVIETIRPLARLIEGSSIKGLEIAATAALSTRFSPEASPLPIMALPFSRMTERTSAKSRLIRPSLTIRSLMQATPE